jgi:hypothetical protein
MVRLCGCFYQNTKLWCTMRCVWSLKIHAGSSTTLAEHFAKHPHWDREYWTSKGGTTEDISKQLTVDSGFVKSAEMSLNHRECNYISYCRNDGTGLSVLFRGWRLRILKVLAYFETQVSSTIKNCIVWKYSHITASLNILERLQMGKPTIRLTIFL